MRYNTHLNLEKLGERDLKVLEEKAELLEHLKTQRLIRECKTWPGTPLNRHNDAAHPIHKISMLADFGLKLGDPGINDVVTRVLSHQSEDGSFQSLLDVPERYGGKGKLEMSWMLCDAPTLTVLPRKVQCQRQKSGLGCRPSPLPRGQ